MDTGLITIERTGDDTHPDRAPAHPDAVLGRQQCRTAPGVGDPLDHLCIEKMFVILNRKTGLDDDDNIKRRYVTIFIAH